MGNFCLSRLQYRNNRSAEYACKDLSVKSHEAVVSSNTIAHRRGLQDCRGDCPDSSFRIGSDRSQWILETPPRLPASRRRIPQLYNILFVLFYSSAASPFFTLAPFQNRPRSHAPPKLFYRRCFPNSFLTLQKYAKHAPGSGVFEYLTY